MSAYEADQLLPADPGLLSQLTHLAGELVALGVPEAPRLETALTWLKC